MSEAPPVLVLGMHRGGTSAVGQILATLGLDAGPSEGLIGATESNRHGHYEVRKITDLNEEMLVSLGRSWLSPPDDQKAVAALSEGPFRDRALQALNGQFGDKPWFLKDPRLSLLLPFWREILPVQPIVIGVVRSPEAIAKSLFERDGLPAGFGQKLTDAYLNAMICGSQGLESLVLCYEELLDSPKVSVEILAQFLTEASVGDFAYTERSGSVIDPSDNHFDRGNSSDGEILRSWHGHRMPKSFSNRELSPELVELTTVLAAKIQLADHFKGVATEREDCLIEISGELADRRADLLVAFVERDRALAEVEAIRAFRSAEVASTTFQIVALLTRVGAKWFPQESRRRTVISTLLRSGRKAYSSLRSQKGIRRSRKGMSSTSNSAGAIIPVDIGADESPLVSIVIPVYGEVAVTSRCLNSIAMAENETSFEVVVVDDMSPDATSDYLNSCSGIKVVTNSENQGYLQSTNAGAEVSSTKYVVLLNNDTEVCDGWLDDLLSTFKQYPDTGLVGARLVYPDGRLQEAGSIIFSDGTGWNYGRFQDPNDEKFAFVREVDYCSAACVMVKREVWNKVGGFDERFTPAYYEDVDLAFSARSMGWKVRYQPRTKITHYEGVSHGTDEASGLKAYQKINQAVFVEKWAKELKEQMPNGKKNVIASASRGSVGHIFVADYEVPHWDRHAGGLRMQRLLGILVEMGWKVTFAPGNQAASEPYSTELRQAGIEICRGAETPEKTVLGFSQTFDVALLSRPEDGARWLSAFRSASPSTHIIYDTVDLHALRNDRGRVLGQSDQSESAEEHVAEQERRLIDAADQTLVVSIFEKEWLSKRQPSAKVSVVGLVHDEPISETSFAERNGVLFVGSWSHKPNQDAVRFLLNEVMPLLWQELPEIKLHLVGSDMPDSLGDSETRVVCHGWVEDLAPLFSQVRLSLAPLRFGAGLKGKVAESLCRGIPVVGTSVAFEGFKMNEVLRLGEAEGAREIALAASNLYQKQEVWEKSSEAGRVMVADLLGKERVTADLKSVLLFASDSGGEIF